MSVAIGVVFVALALVGIAMGARHAYLRLDRPGGMNCSMRVVRGEVAGLAPRFRAGYAGPQMRELMWRRIAWPDAAVLFPLEAIRVDRERRPARSERFRVPAAFSVMPVELADDVVLELAMPRRRLRRLVDLLDGRGPGTPAR